MKIQWSIQFNTQVLFMSFLFFLQYRMNIEVLVSFFLLLLNYYLFVSIIIILRYSLKTFAAKDTGKITTSCVRCFLCFFSLRRQLFLTFVPDINSILMLDQISGVCLRHRKWKSKHFALFFGYNNKKKWSRQHNIISLRMQFSHALSPSQKTS